MPIAIYVCVWRFWYCVALSCCVFIFLFVSCLPVSDEINSKLIIFNSLLAQLVKYDVYTTSKIKVIHAIFVTYYYFINGNYESSGTVIYASVIRTVVILLPSTVTISSLLVDQMNLSSFLTYCFHGRFPCAKSFRDGV